MSCGISFLVKSREYKIISSLSILKLISKDEFSCHFTLKCGVGIYKLSLISCYSSSQVLRSSPRDWSYQSLPVGFDVIISRIYKPGSWKFVLRNNE